MVFYVMLLAFFWGVVWAAFLQWVPLGQFLVNRRTWITVVVGVGVDLLIALLVVPVEYWQVLALIIVFSSGPIIVRSLILEWGEWREVFNVHKDAAGE